MNIVFIVPTGIGCEIGGHAGDANPVVKLFASLSDNLITHPNAVNASDINEMTENCLYVEGSILDRFLRGEIFLKKVFFNKILLAVNEPLDNSTVNAVNAARATIGADIQIMVLKTPLKMTGFYSKSGKAEGNVIGYLELIEQIRNFDFDALAIQTDIFVKKETKLNYYRNGGINPWGGVEAIASKLIANKLNKPVAHAPYVNWQIEDRDLKDFNEIVDSRMAAEMVSVCYLHCILKGLHKAPRIDKYGLSVDDIDLMISPMCFGEPHKACLEKNIPILYVRENKVLYKNSGIPKNSVVCENYLEAAGFVATLKAGITYKSIRRPLSCVMSLDSYKSNT